MCFIFVVLLCSIIWSCPKLTTAQKRPFHGFLMADPPANIHRSSVFEHQRVVLNCSVELPQQLNPRQVKYRWERPEGHVIGQSKLYVIPNVSRSDEGVYICRSSAIWGEPAEEWSEKHDLHLDIKYNYAARGYVPGGPTIILSPGTPGPLEIRDGDDLYSRCNVEGNGNMYTFRWIRRLPDRSIQELSSNALLFMAGVRRADLEYPIYCRVTRHSDGQEFEQLLNVKTDIRYEVTTRALTPTVLIGRPYSMLCEVTPRPDGPVQYRWYFKDRMVSGDAELRLDSLAFSDIGRYTCQAGWSSSTARHGPVSANSTVEITLALTQERQIEMSPPPGSVLVTLTGATRELHCEYSTRNPDPPRWFFEKEPLEYHPTLNRSGNVYRTDRLLVSIVTLRDITEAQMGTYECHVNGEIKQTHVIVKVEEGIEISPEIETVDEGTTVEFHCQVHGANRPVNLELEWFYRPFHGGPMTPVDFHSPDGFERHDDPHASHTSFASKLRARKSDEGEYICRWPSQNMERVARLYVRTTARYRVVITPTLVRVRINQPIEMECYANEESGRPSEVTPRFRLRDNRIRYDTVRIGENKMSFRIPHGLTTEFNGTEVECYTDEPGNTAVAIIIVETTCPQGYRRCQSGECLPAGRFCDGVRDCQDGSDENPLYCNACDPIAKQCEVYQNRQPIKKTYMVHWECDGEDDCGNGFDESNCPDPTVARCDGVLFDCQSGNRRIPLAYTCDKDPDCPNGEDERYCAGPAIQSADIMRYPVRQGSQLTLTCRVSGNPLPRVIWRFNWGCLPDEGYRIRVTSTAQNCGSPSSTVISTLTITNVRPGDDGIYNCEALSGGTRAMSNDYIVLIEG